MGSDLMALLAKSNDKGGWAEEGGHWYCAVTGEARYEIKGANGQMRGTTLRDARKHNLVPSVTTIAQVEAKPQLTRWLVEQGMMACLTLPRKPGENATEFMARALDDSKQQVIAASKRGSYLHGLLESMMRDGACIAVGDDLDYVIPVYEWIRDNFPGYIWSVERTIPTAMGFGGKVDLTGTHPTLSPVTIDYKCKDFDDPKKKLAYDEHCTQLAAYSHAMYTKYYVAAQQPRGINIFISSTVPGYFIVKEWPPEDLARGWLAFQAMKDLWMVRKDFP
jgi:hypothetical protein